MQPCSLCSSDELGETKGVTMFYNSCEHTALSHSGSQFVCFLKIKALRNHCHLKARSLIFSVCHIIVKKKPTESAETIFILVYILPLGNSFNVLFIGLELVNLYCIEFEGGSLLQPFGFCRNPFQPANKLGWRTVVNIKLQ